MSGMHRTTGLALSGWSHVVQSITDILTTPLGTRVMRRDYGCDHGFLIDKPGTQNMVVTVTRVVTTALDRWEPRFQLVSCQLVEGGQDGYFAIDIEGIYYSRGHLGDRSVSEAVNSLHIRIR